MASGADYSWAAHAYATGITRNLTPSVHKGNKNVCYQPRLYTVVIPVLHGHCRKWQLFMVAWLVFYNICRRSHRIGKPSLQSRPIANTGRAYMCGLTANPKIFGGLCRKGWNIKRGVPRILVSDPRWRLGLLPDPEQLERHNILAVIEAAPEYTISFSCQGRVFCHGQPLISCSL